MGNVLDIDSFKRRRYQRLEQERQQLMQRYETLHAEGKTVFAEKALAKAKELRKELSKLREFAPEAEHKVTLTPISLPFPGIAFSVGISGNASKD